MNAYTRNVLLIFLLVFASCGTTNSFKKDRAAFTEAKVLMSFRSVADMNDSYFTVKENNFFEFYKVLYDSVKNTSYPGRYLMNADTMELTFYNKKGYELLGKRALIDRQKKEIVFFDHLPGRKKGLLVN